MTAAVNTLGSRPSAAGVEAPSAVPSEATAAKPMVPPPVQPWLATMAKPTTSPPLMVVCDW